MVSIEYKAVPRSVAADVTRAELEAAVHIIDTLTNKTTTSYFAVYEIL